MGKSKFNTGKKRDRERAQPSGNAMKERAKKGKTAALTVAEHKQTMRARGLDERAMDTFDSGKRVLRIHNSWCDRTGITATAAMGILATVGVIYIMFSAQTNLIYIGQTHHSASHRVWEHIRAGRRLSWYYASPNDFTDDEVANLATDPLARCIADTGWKNWAYRVLQVVPFDGNPEDSKWAFAQVANYYENLWQWTFQSYNHAWGLNRATIAGCRKRKF